MRLPSKFLSTAILIFLAASLASTTIAAEGGVTITRVIAEWREAASFKRISEYFTGHENTGRITVLRTHADQRSGFYFFLRVANPASPTPVKITVEVITPTDTKPKAHTFTADLKSGENLINLGLTATDWPDAQANPVAWKIDLIDSAGQVLVSEKSYLWEKPATK